MCEATSNEIDKRAPRKRPTGVKVLLSMYIVSIPTEELLISR